MILVQWKIFEEGSKPCCGHGIEFHVNMGSNRQSLIAFIDGFEWYHGSSNEMLVWILKGLEFDLPDVYATVLEAIKEAATKRKFINGDLSNGVTAWVNG
jgi:hypothetical protein